MNGSEQRRDFVQQGKILENPGKYMIHNLESVMLAEFRHHHRKIKTGQHCEDNGKTGIAIEEDEAQLLNDNGEESSYLSEISNLVNGFTSDASFNAVSEQIKEMLRSNPREVDRSSPVHQHATLEALEKTKAIIAQLTMSALADGSDGGATKDLTLLHSTLFTLQHQQVYQLQLIEQLQSQLSQTRAPKKKSKTSTDETKASRLESESKVSNFTDEKINEAHISTNEPSIEGREENNFISGIQVASAPNISSLLASSIITNHDNSTHCGGTSSLELLQKRAEEVLDSATQSFSTGNLMDELSYRTGAFLNDNQRNDDPTLKHRCRFCGKIFGSDSALQIHLRSHTGERPFKCLVCGSRFTTKGNLKVHYQRHTETMSAADVMKLDSRALHDLGAYSVQPKPDDELHNDDAKSTKLNEKEENNDTSVNAEESIEMTPFVDRKTVAPFYHQDIFSSKKKAWEKYMEIVNTPKASELQRDEAYRSDPNKCPICNRILSCRSALRQHYHTHTGERPYRCRLCMRSFTTKGNLKTHIGVHKINPLLNPVHQCTMCVRKYSTFHALQQHINTHTGAPIEMTIDQIRAAEVHDFTRNGELYGSNSSLGDFSETSGIENSCDSEMQRRNDLKNVSRVVELSDDDDVPGPEKKMRRDSESENFEKVRENDHRSSVSMQGNSEYSMDRSKSPGGDREPDASRLSFLSNFPPIFNTSPNPAPFYGGNLSSLMQPSSYSPIGIPTGVRGATTCNICFKTFACHSALEIHYRSHTKEKPYVCQLCHRGFSTKGNMKQHMLTHKIRDMPQHVFRNSVTQSSPSSDSNNSLSTMSGSQPNKLNRTQQQTELRSQLQCGISGEHSFDDTQNADRLRRQLNASHENHNSEIHSPAMTDQRDTVYLSSDESNSMSLPAQFKNNATNATANRTDSVGRSRSTESSTPPRKLSSKAIDDAASDRKSLTHRSSSKQKSKLQCPICIKSFSTKGNLKTHIRKHKMNGEHMTNSESRFCRSTDISHPFLATAAAMQQKRKEANSYQKYATMLHNDLSADFLRKNGALANQNLFGFMQFPFQMFGDPLTNHK